MAHYQLRFGDKLKSAIIGQERHEDGEPHLHCVISFISQLNVRRSDYFDVRFAQRTYHPNIQSARDRAACIMYCAKEDPDPVLFNVDIDGIRSSKSSSGKQKEKLSDVIAKMLCSGTTLRELNDQMPGWFMLNKRKVAEYVATVDQWREQSQLLALPLDVFIVKPTMSDAVKAIVTWLASAIRVVRVNRSPQLFLYGPPGVGKSRLICHLSRYLAVYTCPMDEDFYDLYTDDYDLIVLDEFKGQKFVQWLLRLLDGQTLNLRQKGTQYLKKKNTPVIILSNYHPDNCYKNVDCVSMEAFRSRLTIVNVTEDFIVDSLVPVPIQHVE